MVVVVLSTLPYSRPYYLIQRTTSALGDTKQIRIMLRKCD